MDFKDLMNIASNNQVNAVKKKDKNSKDSCSGQVSSAAVKAFLARQNAEKAKQKEREEAARRARIQARLQGKQLPDNSTTNKKPEDSQKHRSARPTQNSNSSTSKSNSNHRLTQNKRTEIERSVVKSKGREKMTKKRDEKPRAVEQKKPAGKTKKPAPPTMSFQELMNIAKKQADNPDASRSFPPEKDPKHRKDVEEKSLLDVQSVGSGKRKEVSEKNNKVPGKSNREKNVISQNRHSVKNQQGKLPDTAKRKKPEIGDRKPSELQVRKLQVNRDGHKDRRSSGKTELGVQRKASEKPRTMTIERQTISQRDYGSPMKYRESKDFLQRKRRLHDDDEYDDDMDEFIDDSEDAPETVSTYIKEIFGYDRNKFRDRDEDTSDMVSSFGQIQREEAKSLRIAKLEDEVEKLKESYELQQQQRKRKKLKH